MLTIYHNPRCSKSRQTLQLIEQSNTPVTIVEYLKTPLNQEQIKTLLALLKIPAIEMMRIKEEEFKTLQLKGASEEKLIAAMVNCPKLIERPIVTKVNSMTTENSAVIGRPPENVLTLI